MSRAVHTNHARRTTEFHRDVGADPWRRPVAAALSRGWLSSSTDHSVAQTAAYDPGTDPILEFTNDGPKGGPDPWKTRMDLAEAAAQGHP